MRLRLRLCVLTVGLALAGCGSGGSDPGGTPPPLPTGSLPMGDKPVMDGHLAQTEIQSGQMAMADVLLHGQHLFEASFNTLDGAGRPESLGTGPARARRDFPQNMNRFSAPDANSCAGCHNLPRTGGGGDNVANVFVMAQRLPFVSFDGGLGDGGATQTLSTVGNERNTLGMFGSGYVELLAREMTAALQAQRAAAGAAALSGATTVMAPLNAKGVSFGSITARPDGSFDTSGVQGIDADLVLRPFHQKGVVVSLREFTNNAMNHHHGLQSVERFGAGVDADHDGHVDELTAGDITAASVFQACLPPPGRVLPPDAPARAAVTRGEGLFGTLGCAGCHVPSLRLDSPLFSEPNPYNPAGNLRLADVAAPCTVDLATVGPTPRLPRQTDGSVEVPLFSDLKRHDMGPGLTNETLVQAGVPRSQWLTKKLWGFASEPPFLHHGRATLISEAILAHGGEGQAVRDAYAALSAADQAAVVEFLKILQILPVGETRLEITAPAPGPIGDAAAVAVHTAQSDVNAHALDVDTLIARGKALFSAGFNTLDGFGRPETTGTGVPRPRRVGLESFNRISGPDANSCMGCHNLPRIGGGGDIVADVFVLGQRFPFVNFDGGAGDGFEVHTLQSVANQRNSLGMFGSGWIEILAREMTTDLQALRATVVAEAVSARQDITKPLQTKGVDFGWITAHPDGSLDTSRVAGVNADLVVRPFHQKGAVVSLRQFTNNAVNHHHGMQSSERFGAGLDPDADGRTDELTQGDITALTIFQATLPVPGRAISPDPSLRLAAARGEYFFGTLGCAACHRPTLRASSPIFSEPNPFNPAGNLRPSDVPAPYGIDLTTQGPLPRLPREADGSVLVPAFTDLKRHDMGPVLDNELLLQDGIPTAQWITKKLWGFFSEPSFLHTGKATLISEAILAHGGEGQSARDAYALLPEADRTCVAEFLRTLQILPEGPPSATLVR